MSINLLIAALLGTAVIFLYAYSDWQRAIKLALVIVVFEGALRKWVLPQASELIYFLKDLILLGAYVSYYRLHVRFSKTSPSKDLLDLFIIILTIWGAIEVFNARLGSPVVGVLGLKAYIFYLPMIWLLPTLFSTQEQLYKFLRNYLLLTIPIGVLGIIQYYSPAYNWINVYAPGEVTDAALVGSRVRITGTFSYLAGYGIYLMIAFGLLLPLLTTTKTWLWRLLMLSALLLVVVNSFMSGSRTVVFTQILLLVMYFAFQIIRHPIYTVRVLRGFAVPALIVGYIAFSQFRPAIDNFLIRVTTSQDLEERVIDSVIGPFLYAEYTGVLGYGIGATLPAGSALRAMFGLSPGEWIPVYYESEMARVMLEIGPFGFVIWYIVRSILLIKLFVVFWRLNTPTLRQLALSAFLIHLIQFSGQLVANHTFGVYYWFLASFSFMLPRLDEIQDSSAQKVFKENYVSTVRHPRPSYG